MTRVPRSGSLRAVDPKSSAHARTARNFGHEDHVTWTPVEGLAAQSELLAHYVQHRICVVLRRHIEGPAHQSSIAAFAEALHVNETTLQRKFRGDAPATVAEMLMWCAALGVLDEFATIFEDLANNRMPALSPQADGTSPQLKLWRLGPLRRKPAPVPPGSGND